MIEVMCKIISLDHKQQTGIMFKSKHFTFENLIDWVYRNCPNYLTLEIKDKSIWVVYEERAEIYYLREKQD